MRQLPNILTLLNPFFAILAYWQLAAGDEQSFFILYGISFLTDLLDGALARAFNTSSELGVQLDSLADAISFGAVPALALFLYWPEFGYLKYFCAVIPSFAVLRLAIFNISSDEQTGYFLGMPTPAMSLSVVAIIILLMNGVIISALTLSGCVIVLGYLMVSRVRMLNFKFQGWDFRSNFWRYLFILVIILSVIFVPFTWIMAAIMAGYIIISFLFHFLGSP